MWDKIWILILFKLQNLGQVFNKVYSIKHLIFLIQQTMNIKYIAYSWYVIIFHMSLIYLHIKWEDLFIAVMNWSCAYKDTT